MYNYLEAMKADIREAIREGYTLADYENRDELEETLNDDLWIDDSVTGNASGSYTFNSSRAAEYVQADGEEYLREAVEDFCIDAGTVAEHFLRGDWEYFDVTIRCYLLAQAISAVLDEMEEEEEEGEEEEEEQETESAKMNA